MKKFFFTRCKFSYSRDTRFSKEFFLSTNQRVRQRSTTFFVSQRFSFLFWFVEKMDRFFSLTKFFFCCKKIFLCFEKKDRKPSFFSFFLYLSVFFIIEKKRNRNFLFFLQRKNVVERCRFLHFIF